LREKSEKGKLILFGTTHIYYKDEEAKKLQIRELISKATELKELWEVSQCILTGDFNVPPHHPMINWMKELKDFTSVFLDGAPADAPHPYTSFGGSASHIDYIWYSKGTLDLVGYVPLPNLPMLLPNESLSSDHIAIKANFQFQ
jgi:endonuclease/exonuclease/phosphatase family metal-dependent hydrolase